MSLPRSRRPLSALLLAATLACAPGPENTPDSGTSDAGPVDDGTVTVNVGDAFPTGTALVDALHETPVTVAADGTVKVTPGAEGLVLLEKADASPGAFSWDNATVYFAVTDRFFNGNTANDGAYGRKKDGDDEVGTWHGGDLAGLTQKLDHIVSLGADAVWITPIVEQVHGWVGGGSGAFRHYGYHGYWALDFTKLDENLGTEEELHAFVDAAHQRGLRVLLDVVMNHPGYATGDDLLHFLPESFNDSTGAAFSAFDALTTPPSGKTWHAWNDLVNYQHIVWKQRWWGVPWVRAGIRDYTTPGTDDMTKSLEYLPDFKTEVQEFVGLPPLLTNKPDTRAVALEDARVRDYLVAWQADWVRRFGFDGFRCDTAKHVELPTWKALKDAGVVALTAWRAENPGKSPGSEPFWMVAEVFPHGVNRDGYITQGGFNAIINFDFGRKVDALNVGSKTLWTGLSELDTTYASMATALRAETDFNVLSYLSSHDTQLLLKSLKDDVPDMRDALTALFLAPGAVQLFYGDESGRKFGPTGGDATQGTRSDMNWDSMDAVLLDHSRKLGNFRKKHRAIGGGTHTKLTSPDGTYAFTRRLADGTDAVVVVMRKPE